MDEQAYGRFLVSLIRATGNAEDVNDLCRYLILDTLVSFGVIAAVFYGATPDGRLKPVGGYGVSLNEAKQLTFAEAQTEASRSLLQVREATVLSSKAKLCSHPDHPPEVQENLLLPAISRGIFVGALVLIIERASVLKQPDILPKATRLLQESLSSVVQKSNVSASQRSTKTPTFEPALLSPRQKEILALIAEDLTSLQIARTLNVSESLVKKELVLIYRTLGTTSRPETIMRYRQHQLMPWVSEQLSPPPIGNGDVGVA